MNFYDLEAKNIKGNIVRMKEYQGKVLLIVNTASKCGFTPQFTALEEVYQQYHEKGFAVLGFPCNQFAKQDPGTNQEVESFCQLNYGVTFPMFEKIDVNGSNAHPIYQYLRNQAKGLISDKVKWNFTKFLVDQEGNVVKRFGPTIDPLNIKKEIEALINVN